jgi:hypothetical protein
MESVSNQIMRGATPRASNALALAMVSSTTPMGHPRRLVELQVLLRQVALDAVLGEAGVLVLHGRRVHPTLVSRLLQVVYVARGLGLAVLACSAAAMDRLEWNKLVL